jgi:hypothetical protein
MTLFIKNGAAFSSQNPAISLSLQSAMLWFNTHIMQRQVQILFRPNQPLLANQR